MPVLLDVNFSFFCRTTYKSENGKCPIILRVNYSGVRRDIFTGIYSSAEDWDNKSKRIKNDAKDSFKINSNLDLVERNAHSAFDELKFMRQKFTIDDIVTKLKGTEDKPELLVDYLQHGLLRMKKRVGTDITKATFQKYKRTILHMQEFLDSS
ncbi:MAG: Arm DNA-binding domain-containing protein [Flavobacterium sp.]